MSSIAGLKKHPTPTLNTSPTPAIQISEDKVCQVLQMEKSKKAPGPDGVTPVCLKSCADQLAPTSTDQVPSCFKCSTIKPILNKSKITGLNDYRPVALMSVVMKVIWKTDVGHLKDITGPQDLLQFTYRANRSVDGAVNMGLHYVLQHLDRPGAYVRILFVDFSSAFNDRICSVPQNSRTYSNSRRSWRARAVSIAVGRNRKKQTEKRSATHYFWRSTVLSRCAGDEGTRRRGYF